MANPKGNPATLTRKYEPKWKHGKTQTIRVPIELANQILEYAHQLDEKLVIQANQVNDEKFSAAATQDQDKKRRETLTQVISVIEKVCETPHTSKFTKAMKAKLQAYAINPLKALTQAKE